MTGRRLHDYVCLLNGVRDPDVVERLWTEEQARQRAARSGSRGPHARRRP